MTLLTVNPLSSRRGDVVANQSVQDSIASKEAHVKRQRREKETSKMASRFAAWLVHDVLTCSDRTRRIRSWCQQRRGHEEERREGWRVHLACDEVPLLIRMNRQGRSTALRQQDGCDETRGQGRWSVVWFAIRMRGPDIQY